MARARTQAGKVVFLVGEGKHDIGGLAYGPNLQTDSPGYLQAVLGRMSSSQLAFRGQRLSALPKERLTRPKDVLARRGRIAARVAQLDGADALVIVTDVDSEPGKSGRAAAVRRMAQLQRLLHNGIAAAETDIPAIVGTPLRTIEAWTLGDSVAVQKVAGRRAPVRIPKPPEELWGHAHDPDSNHPKHVLRRQFDRPIGHDDYAAIGRRSDLAKVARACPASFAPFAAAVRRIL
jgi:hypothetical protein